MQEQPLDAFLAAHPFFKELDQAYLHLLAGCASNVVFQPGQYLFREGDQANRFFAIRQGKVALEIAVPGRVAITIETLDDGDVLGWSWIVPPHTKQFDARAVELTRALAFDATCLRGKCEHDPKLGFELMKRFTQLLGQRLQATRLQLLDVYTSSA
ncbi:MAG: cyclic nucleotide-binding domain-containing protein [Candidatus Omnitrophica bacterium]|nr:cyclic nucleotide-binding domain-containing protein [Candidatus Omnitrophota bacterium]